MVQADIAGGGPHILLSSMGASGPRDSMYFFESEGRCQTSPTMVSSAFSATALWQLLPQDKRPDEIWFLLTPKAKKVAWDGIETEGKKIGVPVKPLLMKGGDSANDASLVLETTAQELPEGAALTLDITQGLRHHAFLFFALALYVSKFRDNHLEGVWYSRMETDDRGDPKPVIDLKPVLDLANWFVALSEFQDTGSLRALSRLVPEAKVGKLFAKLSHEFLTGLPVEAGITAGQVVALLDSDSFRLAGIPLEPQVRELIQSEVKGLASSYKKKSDYRLDQDELDRQAKFIDRYLDTGQDNLAFGFMREWMVNHGLAKDGAEGDWLSLKRRSRAEGQLGCLTNLLAQKGDPNKDRISEQLKKQAQLWGNLGEIRNALQHHGMRPDGIPCKPALKLRKEWESREDWSELPAFGGGAGTLLICPLGNTAGVLYSALQHVRPDRCVVVCSAQTEPAVNEAISRTGWVGEQLILLMQDVHRGVGEFKALLELAKPWLFQADLVEANLTGGTSLMGVLVGRLVEHAGRTYRRPTRKFVLIDSRPYEIQRDQPWVTGDIHYINRESDQSGGEG